MLPLTLASPSSLAPILKSEDQRIAAMGAKKMMSPKSRFVGANLRAPAATKTQGRENDKVHWTPVFARGKVHIYVCDADAARCDPRLPAHLNNGIDVGKLISNVLPDIIERMKQEYGWTRVPRTVVHDKASYFVAPRLRDEPRTVAGVAGVGGGCMGDGELPQPRMWPCTMGHWAPRSRHAGRRFLVRCSKESAPHRTV